VTCYVNVGQLSVEKTHALVDNMKNEYQELEADLKSNGIRMMWLPTRTRETGLEYLMF
jgi:hypothetical protein